MKAIIPIILIPILIVSPSCLSLTAVEYAQTESYVSLYPESIWISNDNKSIAFVGYVLSGDKKLDSHIVLQRKDIYRAGNSTGKVAMSDLRKFISSDDSLVKIYSGLPSNRYSRIEAITKESSPISIKSVTSSNPQMLLLLPITIVVDVLTLPIQIPSFNSLSKV